MRNFEKEWSDTCDALHQAHEEITHMEEKWVGAEKHATELIEEISRLEQKVDVLNKEILHETLAKEQMIQDVREMNEAIEARDTEIAMNMAGDLSKLTREQMLHMLVHIRLLIQNFHSR